MGPRAELRRDEERRRGGRASGPRGRRRSRPHEGPVFCVQKHAASRLHYDFRLEVDGVLKSWAVPKGPSLDPRKKRFAVATEDHPLEYADFEGVIPEGEYGGGVVLLWDQGEWEPVGDPAEGLAQGKLVFRLHGEKLRGGFALVRLKRPDARDGRSWLLVKERDKGAAPEVDVLDERPESVLTGRGIAQIAEEEGGSDTQLRRARRLEAGEGDGARGEPELDTAALPGARAAPPPGFVAPALAVVVDDVPAGAGWLHEMRLGGDRLLGGVDEDGAVTLWSGAARERTRELPHIANALARLAPGGLLVDGEVVVFDDEGRPSPELLRAALAEGRAGDCVYQVFDVLWAIGHDLREVPLVGRKEALRALLGDAAERPSRLRYTDHIDGNGPLFLEEACRHGLGGVVSKRAGAPYASGEAGDWLEVRCPPRGGPRRGRDA